MIKLFGSCAKRKVICKIVAPNGEYWMGENICASPQEVCPRLEGEGYEKCDSVCKQVAHAEQVAAGLARDQAHDGVAYLSGHYYACDDCQTVLRSIGVNKIVLVGNDEV